MNPIVFTDAAVDHIQKMVDQTTNALGFRLSIKKTGCSGFAYVPDIINVIKPEDVHFTVQKDLQVYVDSASLTFLQDILIDYVADNLQGLKQKRLVFVNPKEKSRCGCGESFTIE